MEKKEKLVCLSIGRHGDKDLDCPRNILTNESVVNAYLSGAEIEKIGGKIDVIYASTIPRALVTAHMRHLACIAELLFEQALEDTRSYESKVCLQRIIHNARLSEYTHVHIVTHQPNIEDMIGKSIGTNGVLFFAAPTWEKVAKQIAARESMQKVWYLNIPNERLKQLAYNAGLGQDRLRGIYDRCNQVAEYFQNKPIAYLADEWFSNIKAYFTANPALKFGQCPKWAEVFEKLHGDNEIFNLFAGAFDSLGNKSNEVEAFLKKLPGYEHINLRISQIAENGWKHDEVYEYAHPDEEEEIYIIPSFVRDEYVIFEAYVKTENPPFGSDLFIKHGTNIACFSYVAELPEHVLQAVKNKAKRIALEKGEDDELPF